MLSDPIICVVCDLVFERSETKPLGGGHRACVDCYEQEGLTDVEARANVLFDLTDGENE